MEQQLWKIVFQFIKLLNIDLPYYPAILHLKMKILIYVHAETCKQMVIRRSLIYNSQKSGNNSNVHQMANG